MYIRNRSVVGCIMTEFVSENRVVAIRSFDEITTTTTTTITTSNASTSGIDLNFNGNDIRFDKKLLGVRIVWVSAQYRRQHIANRLVDAARQYEGMLCLIM